ncbi:hypothetical protein [Inmirania thermothiophila]|uniref:Tetratricopeptide repeat protein n=1 Tax=Inmirania thermothiophila TaxID=1750597 RepID=A0A3N1Y7R4_9GAMM|nr:hypothetical protein [Inmirania thermothiophila]ROR34876.1 tetratricopeptide repeat protein [Inmirania thermothiophila]
MAWRAWAAALLLAAAHAAAAEESSAEMYTRLGAEVEARGDYLRAVEYYRKALLFDIGYGPALNRLGHALRRLAEIYAEEAVGVYEHALRRDPANARALREQGELLIWRGELARARANLRRLEGLDPEEAGILRRALERR